QAHSLEGYLFPETYQFSRMMTMQEMAAAMVRQFRQVATQIGLTGSVSPDAPTPGYSLHEVVTMASIVEKESAVPEERPMVASVYYNRLNSRVALDADPSIIYAKLLDGTYQ